MPISFSTALDSFTKPLAFDRLDNPSHAGLHSDAIDAVETVEGLLVGPGWVNVKAEGAVGDGVTNDTTAILAALDKVRALAHATPLVGAITSHIGPVLYFPPGRYLLNPDVFYVDDILHLTIIGCGSRGGNDFAQGASTIVINGASTGFGIKLDTNGARNFRMEGIAVEYNSDLFTGDLFVADATHGHLVDCSFTFDNDNDIPGTAIRFSANSCIKLLNKQWKIDHCFTTGASYGVYLSGTAPGAGANYTSMIACTFGDHPIAGVGSDPATSPLDAITIISCYFDIVRLDGVSFAKPLNGLKIKDAGFVVAGCWFSGATAAARWTGYACVVQGTGVVHGCTVRAVAGGISVEGSGGTVSLLGNIILGDPPVHIVGGVVTESAGDYSVTSTGAATQHVNVNPTSQACIFTLGPSRFRSTVANSYLVSPSTNNEGVVYHSGLRDGSLSGASIPVGVHSFNLDASGSMQLANPVILATTRAPLQWASVSHASTSVGTTGGAAAPPATPAKYLKVLDAAGTTLYVPAYLST